MMRRAILGVVICSLAAFAAHRRSAPAPLRVCADPNNLPYSNVRLEGFENRLAELVARDLGMQGVDYTWWAQRRGFFRHTLNAKECDVVLGVPSGLEIAMTTRPYYRSSYVFVTRKGRHSQLTSLDDPRLHRLRVGVQLVGDDGANSPPAHGLGRRGIIRNVVGFSVYGDYSTANPPSRIISAVAAGDIDVAIAWGPMAGFFGARAPVPLDIVPVSPQIDLPFLPFVFDMSMAVRRGDDVLLERLETFIDRRRSEIDALLASYNIPRVDLAEERTW